MDTPSPDGGTYVTWESAWDSLQAWAKTQGFASVKVREHPDKQGITRKVILECDKRGRFKSSSSGKRETASRKEEYKWQTHLLRDPSTALWRIQGMYMHITLQ